MKLKEVNQRDMDLTFQKKKEKEKKIEIRK